MRYKKRFALSLSSLAPDPPTRATLSDAQFHVHEVTQHAVGDGDFPQQPRRRAVDLRRLSNPRHGLREDPRRRLAKFPRSRPELRRGPPWKRQRGERPRAVERRLAQQLEGTRRDTPPTSESSCAVGTFPRPPATVSANASDAFEAFLAIATAERDAALRIVSAAVASLAKRPLALVLKRNPPPRGARMYPPLARRVRAARARAHRASSRRLGGEGLAHSRHSAAHTDNPPSRDSRPTGPKSKLRQRSRFRPEPRSRTGTRLRLSVSRHRRAAMETARTPPSSFATGDGARVGCASRRIATIANPSRVRSRRSTTPPLRPAAALSTKHNYAAAAFSRRRHSHSSSSLVSLSALDLGEPLGEVSSCLSAHVCASFWPSSKSSLSLYGSGGKTPTTWGRTCSVGCPPWSCRRGTPPRDS